MNEVASDLSSSGPSDQDPDMTIESIRRISITAMVLLLVLGAASAQTTSTPLNVDGVLRLVATFHRISQGSLAVTMLGSPGARSGTKYHWDITPVSRFDFSGQLREEGDIAVEFLCQTTDYCPGRHHPAADHLKQLHRVDAQLSAQPEDVSAPTRAQSANMPTELIDLRLWHLG
jgi:hypothetical protein